MRRFAALATMLVVVMGLVLAGCGGSDDSSSDDGEKVEANDDDGGNDDASNDDNRDDNSDDDSDDDGSSEFADRLEEQAKVRVKVTYETNNGDLVYTIVRGEVEVIREEADGAERLLSKMGPGEYFGEMALISDAPRTATVRASPTSRR